MPAKPRVQFQPVTPDRWSDMAKLFGKRGACAGCWCMYWRLARSEFDRRKGDGNRRAMYRVVKRGGEPGLLAYVNGEPAGWCSVAPREQFPGLARSRILKPVDDQPVWSITCLFIQKDHRRTGLSARLLAAAVKHVKRSGGKVVEGYPVEPRKDRMPDAFAWTGIASAYLRAGFREVARRSDTRPIMRKGT